MDKPTQDHKELRFPTGFPRELRGLALNSAGPPHFDPAKFRSFEFEPYFDHDSAVEVLEQLLRNDCDVAVYLFAVYSLYASSDTDNLQILASTSEKYDGLDRPLTLLECRETFRMGLECLSTESDEYIEREVDEHIGYQYFYLKFLPSKIEISEPCGHTPTALDLQQVIASDVHAELLKPLKHSRTHLQDLYKATPQPLVAALQIFTLNDTRTRVEQWQHIGLIRSGQLLLMPYELACAKSIKLALQHLSKLDSSDASQRYVLLECNYAPWPAWTAKEAKRKHQRYENEPRIAACACFGVVLAVLAAVIFLANRCGP